VFLEKGLLIDKMYKNKSGSDIDKKLEMLEGMKSELDAYQENQSKYEPAAQNFLDGLRFFMIHSSFP
jgi:hypothetical protein